MRILLTGGAGYIGSHTALALIEAGHTPILFDNFINSNPAIIVRLELLSGRKIVSIEGDVRNSSHVRAAISRHGIDAVVHFAAFKAVAESVAQPLSYHLNNVGGLLAVLDAMNGENVRRIVFSSSATVYGNPRNLPIDEDHPIQAINPYGQTKVICENILRDLTAAEGDWRVSLLRYFNPIGAHASGLIGENPNGIPNNLMPLITRAAKSGTGTLSVFGTDYDTRDGSCVRDYIHVVDLAEGHVAALESLPSGDPLQIFNLGTGNGTTVLELLAAFKKATGVDVPYIRANRRSGDVPEMFASAEKAARVLGWRSTRGLEEMCMDSWRFAQRNDLS